MTRAIRGFKALVHLWEAVRLPLRKTELEVAAQIRGRRGDALASRQRTWASQFISSCNAPSGPIKKGESVRVTCSEVSLPTSERWLYFPIHWYCTLPQNRSTGGYARFQFHKFGLDGLVQQNKWCAASRKVRTLDSGYYCFWVFLSKFMFQYVLVMSWLTKFSILGRRLAFALQRAWSTYLEAISLLAQGMGPPQRILDCFSSIPFYCFGQIWE